MEKIKTNIVLISTYITFASMGFFTVFGDIPGAGRLVLSTLAILGLIFCLYLTINLDKAFRMYERKCIEQETITRNKELLLSLIIHDLKGPAQHISLLAQMIDREEVKVPECKQLAKQIHSSAHRHFDLVDRLTEWTRMEVGMKGSQNWFNVHDLTENIAREFAPACEKKEIILMNYIDKHLVTSASKAVLHSLIGNMIQNSVKFTPGGGIITISAAKSKGSIEISISDTGLGMSKENAEKLFCPHTRHIAAGTMNEKGSGIGLLLCNELVKKAGGSIRVQSAPGKGSTFTFTLPEKSSNTLQGARKRYVLHQFINTILP